MRLKQLLLTTALGTAAVIAVTGHLAVLPLRAAVTLPFVLALPGFGLMRAAFAPDELDLAERLPLVLGLSIAIAICAGVVLNLFTQGVQPVSWTIALVSTTVLLEVLAALRAWKQPAPPLAWAAPRTLLAPGLVGAIASGAVGALFALAVHAADAQRFAPFTQFWMLSRAAYNYEIGIESHEAHPELVSLQVTAGRRTVLDVRGVELSPGQSWSTAVTDPDGRRPFRAVLLRDGRPYRTVAYLPRCSLGVAYENLCTASQQRSVSRQASARRRRSR